MSSKIQIKGLRGAILRRSSKGPVTFQESLRGTAMILHDRLHKNKKRQNKTICPVLPNRHTVFELLFVKTPVRSGGPETNRTSDTRFRKPLLYPLSYGANYPCILPQGSQEFNIYINSQSFDP